MILPFSKDVIIRN